MTRLFRISNPKEFHVYSEQTLSEVLLLDEYFSESGWENEDQPKGDPLVGLVRWEDVSNRNRARHIIYVYKSEITEVWELSTRAPDGEYKCVVKDRVARLERV